jgi:WD40 repeat protein
MMMSMLCFAQQPKLVVPTDRTEPVTSVALSANGEALASGSVDKTIKLWDAAGGTVIRTLHVKPSHQATLECATGQELIILEMRVGEIHSVAFSLDGKILASGSDEGTIKLWHVATGKEICDMGGHANSIRSLIFSPDGKILASGGDDRTITLWDVATGKKLHILQGLGEAVTSLVFSPDGKTLASESNDHIMKLWDVAIGKELSWTAVKPNWVRFSGASATAFIHNQPIQAVRDNSNIVLQNLTTGKRLATLTALGDDDWSVVDSSGHFDASPGAMKQMYFVEGLTPVPLDKYKARYYEPGLLSRLLGFRRHSPGGNDG